jgi:hypothetical protein
MIRGMLRQHAKRMAAVAAIYTVEPWVSTPEEILPVSASPQTEFPRPRPELIGCPVLFRPQGLRWIDLGCMPCRHVAPS